MILVLNTVLRTLHSFIVHTHCVVQTQGAHSAAAGQSDRARPQWEFMSHLQHEETVMSAVPAGEPLSHAATNNAVFSM